MGKKEVTVQDVVKALDSKLAYTSVATMLGILEEKKYLAHKTEKRTYIYYPIKDKAQERSNVLKYITQSFFDGSFKSLLAHLAQGNDLTNENLDELKDIIRSAEEKKQVDFIL